MNRGVKSHRISLILAVLTFCFFVSGCTNKQKMKEFILRTEYQTVQEYLRTVENGAQLVNDSVSLVADETYTAALACGSFVRDDREITLYCMGTGTEDPITVMYVSELPKEQTAEITAELCSNLPAAYVAGSVRPGRNTYLPVKVFENRSGKEASKDALRSLPEYSCPIDEKYKYAFACLPAGLTSLKLDSPVVQPTIIKNTNSRLSGLDGGKQFINALETGRDVIDLTRFMKGYAAFTPELMSQYIDFLRYNDASWRNQLFLEIHLKDCEFSDKEAEFITFVKKIGVAGVAFYGPSGDCRAVLAKECHKMNIAEETHFFYCPTYIVFRGEDPDAAASVDIYKADTLEKISFTLDASTGRVGITTTALETPAPSSEETAGN